MAKEWAKWFYNSKAWKKCRTGYIAGVYGLCEKCEAPGYILHHKKELTPENIHDPNVSLNWNNLEYLCLVCHNREHGNSDHEVIREGLAFDSNGNVVRV
jgi:5-methylcytosine-specific restriction enzyme A